jgi:hypothetical protein
VLAVERSSHEGRVDLGLVGDHAQRRAVVAVRPEQGSRCVQDLASGCRRSGPSYLVAIGALGITAWLWMVWAVIKQRRWARPAATTLFVLASGLAVANLTVREYGQTILPTQVGLVGLLPCLAGLAAVTLLWMRERR